MRTVGQIYKDLPWLSFKSYITIVIFFLHGTFTKPLGIVGNDLCDKRVSL